MKIYFPQWQGSGKGFSILQGAKTILDYLDDTSIVEIPLSNIPSGEVGGQQHYINNYDAITEQLSRLKDFIAEENPNQIRVIGGDCGLEIVPVSFLNKKYPNLGVIWFDAHADINRPCDSPSCNFHGMPLRTLLGEGEREMDKLLFSKIKDSQIHYLGLRDVDKKEQQRIEEGGIYNPRHIAIESLVTALRKKEITHLYLHFDFDCLEPLEYDQTYYQVSSGLKIEEALSTIKQLQTKFIIVGGSVLESTATTQNDLLPITPIIDILIR